MISKMVTAMVNSDRQLDRLLSCHGDATGHAGEGLSRLVNWGGTIHLKWGWYNSIHWGPELNKKGKIRLK